MRASQILCAFLLGSVAACDIDLFGTDAGKLAGGYRLKIVQGFPGFEYELLPPGKNDGEHVDEIGWKKPFILVKLIDRKKTWEVIDTASDRCDSISDEERRTNPNYRDIQVYLAEDAYKRLSSRRRLWRW